MSKATLDQLNHFFYLAAYAKSITELRKGLESSQNPLSVAYPCYYEVKAGTCTLNFSWNTYEDERLLKFSLAVCSSGKRDLTVVIHPKGSVQTQTYTPKGPECPTKQNIFETSMHQSGQCFGDLIVEGSTYTEGEIVEKRNIWESKEILKQSCQVDQVERI
ncbi:hypothetical protein GLAREA_07242 [Glarea lozoyensis ATCC 20868]|uniref:Uncharacterized protein n=1 Tax=Glarea lozoyensis (strain ATCC 20868 / MF5171) TaxID=1116229 RepID=S3DAU5_GLAL2|nr:uncharacterized protein GLAREA_07242 [Glarea lozoyensis ATCC 20868]EPE34229.1 hypothetical protein GLAREA_07242 [Glarea lozoyensis ATCC 20868]